MCVISCFFSAFFSIASSCTCPSTFYFSKLWCHLANSHNPFLSHSLPQTPTVPPHAWGELPDSENADISVCCFLIYIILSLSPLNLTFDPNQRNEPINLYIRTSSSYLSTLSQHLKWATWTRNRKVKNSVPHTPLSVHVQLRRWKMTFMMLSKAPVLRGNFKEKHS